MWWLGGIATAAAVAGLLYSAEHARLTGALVRADLFDVLRLGLYWAWAWAVWQAAANVAQPLWTALARVGALAGLLPMFLF